ncbi:MAG: hypothetical protein GXO59_04435 [Dictyoglomi bacterium]|nr:hypothetical protein [Dictyoglomota bacterium]
MKKLMNLMIILAIVASLFAVYMFYKSYVIFQSVQTIENVSGFNNSLTRVVLYATEYAIAKDEAIKSLYEKRLGEFNQYTQNMNVPKSMEEDAKRVIGEVRELEKLFNNDATDIHDINAKVEAILDDLHDIEVKAIETTRSSILTLLVISIVLGVIMMLSLLYAMYLTKSVLDAVYKLEKLANEMEKGKLSINVDVRGQTEVGKALIRLMEVIDGKLVPLVSSVVESTRQLDTLIDNLDKSSDVMADTVSEFRMQAEQIAAQSDDIRDAIDSALASVSEVLGGTESVANAAVELSQVAEMLNQIVEEGKRSMMALDEAMGRVVSSTGSATERIKELEKWTERINEIVKTVGDIAEQTNLLALNAAIEAARAGEAGKGFAVVAEEIRKLAEGSRQAADEIADVLKTVASNIKKATQEMEIVSKAVEVSGQAEDAMNGVLSKIAEGAIDVSEGAESMAALAEEQTAAAQNISSELDNVRQLAHSFTSSVETISSGVRSISEIAEKIKDISDKLAYLSDDLRQKVEFFKV